MLSAVLDSLLEVDGDTCSRSGLFVDGAAITVGDGDGCGGFIGRPSTVSGTPNEYLHKA